MKKVGFVWVLFESVPRGGADRAGDAIRMGERLEQLLDGLMAYPGARVGLHLTGATLEWLLDHRGATMDAVLRTVRAGRVELLAGTRHGAPYPAIPPRDLREQVRRFRTLVTKLGGHAPRGFWLPEGVWAADIPVQMAREGFRYTFLDSSQLQVPPGRVRPVEGHWGVERLGYALSVFALDASLGGTCMGGVHTLVTALRDRLDAGAPLVTAACPLDRIGKEAGSERRIDVAFSACRELEHRVDMMLPGVAWRRIDQSGTVWSPLRLTRQMAEHSVDPSVVTPRRVSRGRGARDGGLAWHGAAAWDWFFDRYPESNFLHKKMLWASTWVGKLEALIAKRAADGQDPTSALEGLKCAREALYRAQSHGPYWPAPAGGLYDPAVRQAAHQDLVRVQRVIDGVFYPESRYVAHHAVDLDRDGRDEILTSTPCLNTGVSVVGGALFDLAYKAIPVSLVWPAGRRPELEHSRLAAAGVGRPARGRRKRVSSPRPALNPNLDDALRYDRYSRWSFLDHFLGADTTADNFYQCRYPENGDFVTGVYDVVRRGYQRKLQRGEIHLGRNGHIGELNARHLVPVRVEKTYRFDDYQPRLEIHYLIVNRGATPLEATFAPELSFSWPVTGVGFDGDGAEQEPRVRHRIETSDDGTVARGAVDRASSLVLAVQGKPLNVSVQLDQPADWWWFSLKTLARWDGDVRVRSQGTVFLPRWRVSLWGHESQSFQITIELHDFEATPALLDIVDDEQEGDSTL